MALYEGDGVLDNKEQYIFQWIGEVSEKKIELGGYSIDPYATNTKVSIVETPIDGIVPESGHDVIIFIVQDFWRPFEVERWAEFYNEKYTYYKFFADCASKNTQIGGISTNNAKYNLILCQSKRKLSKVKESLPTSSYYQYWDEQYLKQIFGEDYVKVEIIESEE